ncbi:AAA family ATPase [Streptomyces sp. NPDC005423]|uniref:helix-turn-helix transcriptional regulator n=1 Tax=Streptomyces sp. NPDC005423 TaxID=3155343 RepID=UPI0033A33BFA
MGRTAAIHTLGQALAQCAAGRPGTVLVEGPTGCGKSSLLHTLLEQAAATDAVVLCAVGFPAEHAAPYGVLRQLAAGHRALAAALRPGDGDGDGDGEGGGRARTQDMQAFCAELRELSESAVVVVAVDDVHHADEESLAFLQYLARYARPARILLVVAGTPHHEAAHPGFATELMRQPTFRRIRLERLGRAECEALTRAAGHDSASAHHTPHTPPTTGSTGSTEGGGEAAGFFYEASGGNPLLLRALLQEREQARPQDAVPEAGGPFAQAVRACLHRAGPTPAAVAQAAALLGPAAEAELVARLLGLAPAPVRHALTALEAAGLLAGAQVRHPAVAEAVLSGLPAGKLAALHRRAARLLHRRGRPATEAAGQLLAADACLGEPWQATQTESDILCEAAESRLAGDEGRAALRLLEVAHDSAADERRRDLVGIRLARVTWRFSPAAAERRLAGPLAALRAGRLDGEPAQPLAQLLLLQGRLADACDLLEDTGRDHRAQDHQAHDSSRHSGQDGSRERREGSREGGEEGGVSPLDIVIDAPPAAAERLLRSAALTEATMTPIVQALESLTLSDHPERAVPWSRGLLQDAERRGAPGWAAVFATLHAQALLRIGDLPEAAAHAGRALDELPERGGTFPYAAAAVLVRAHSDMGHYTQACRQCDRPLPPEVLRSVHALAFLRARGLHQLSGNQPQAALSDFLAVGRALRAWHIDRPAYLPWRSDAAQALLRLGRPQQAERLVLEQLAAPDARRPWVRGISLHQRALACAGGRQRALWLEQAVDELHRSGDRLATARAMADLGRTRQAEAGAPMKGTATVRAAWNLAKECGALALCKEILPDVPLAQPLPARPGQQPADRPENRLSSSEQRVATLAAQGLTNREISAKLYLTVSTVEQHLTKVYRKLQINGRGDLPVDLALGSGPGRISAEQAG